MPRPFVSFTIPPEQVCSGSTFSREMLNFARKTNAISHMGGKLAWRSDSFFLSFVWKEENFFVCKQICSGEKGKQFRKFIIGKSIFFAGGKCAKEKNYINSGRRSEFAGECGMKICFVGMRSTLWPLPDALSSIPAGPLLPGSHICAPLPARRQRVKGRGNAGQNLIMDSRLRLRQGGLGKSLRRSDKIQI